MRTDSIGYRVRRGIGRPGADRVGDPGGERISSRPNRSESSEIPAPTVATTTAILSTGPTNWTTSPLITVPPTSIRRGVRPSTA